MIEAQLLGSITSRVTAAAAAAAAAGTYSTREATDLAGYRASTMIPWGGLGAKTTSSAPRRLIASYRLSINTIMQDLLG